MSQGAGTISFTDIIKENTSRMLREMELQSPTHFQIYSDMYKEYLHVLDNVFGMLLLSERELLDRMAGGADPGFLDRFGRSADRTTDHVLAQLDGYGDILQWYAKARSQGMKAFDRYMHSMIGAYSEALRGATWWAATYGPASDAAPDTPASPPSQSNYRGA